MKIFSGSSNEELVKGICEHLGMSMGTVKLKTFPSGEKYAQFQENIRGKDVFLVQSTSYPSNDNLMELLIMADAAKRASAEKITAVIPYFGYARQDRKEAPRVPISARLVMDMLELRVDRVVTMDLHADQVGGFWNKPFDHLHFTPSLIKAINGHGIDVIVAPDVGSIKRTTTISDRLGLPMAVIAKRRLGDEKVEAQQFIGNVKKKNVLIVDDLTESAGTLIEASKECVNNGANSVSCAITHGCFTETGYSRLKEAFITKSISHLYVSNSVKTDFNWENEHEYITKVDVSSVFAKAILNIHNNASVSELFK